MIRLSIVAAVLLAASPVLADWRDDAVERLMQENSEKIVEVMFTQPGSLWVSMLPDGSSRDGFAQYACLEVGMSGMPSGESVMIRIWDAYAMAREELVEIGQYRCVKG